MFAFIGAFFFFIAIFLVGKKENLFSKTFLISALFNDINGLKKGNYVHYSGLRGGVVESINFVSDSTIRVDMRMNQELQNLIKKDAKVYIATQGLVGDKVIEIKPSFKSKIVVKDKDTLQAINPFDTHQIIEKLLTTNDNATVISDNLAQLSQRINKPHKGLISTLSNDTSLVNNFTNIIRSLETTGKKIASLSSHLEKITDNIDLDKGALGAVLSDTVLKNNLSNTIKNLNNTSRSSLDLVQNLNSSLEVSTNKNAINVLLKDSVFAKNLKEGIQNFKTSTYKLDQNLEALKHNIFFRKYFRKQKNKQ